MIAALYVQTGGCYFGLPNVEPWDKDRDARTYDGPYPVIAHPPCERWGRYHYGQAGLPVGDPRRKKLGDDDGCFESALIAVRRWGGVIEHPEASHAWPWFRLQTPDWHGGWIPADDLGGFTCCVSQRRYGHESRKMTWLYVFGLDPNDLPALRWGPLPGKRMEDSYHSASERREKRARSNGYIETRLSHKARAATPIEFRDLLISIAEQCDPSKARRLQEALPL